MEEEGGEKKKDSVSANVLSAQNQTLIRITPSIQVKYLLFDRFTPKDPYMGRTAPLTSKCFILYIYSTNISTEYFKHALYSPFFLFKMQFVS